MFTVFLLVMEANHDKTLFRLSTDLIYLCFRCPWKLETDRVLRLKVHCKC